MGRVFEAHQCFAKDWWASKTRPTLRLLPVGQTLRVHLEVPEPEATQPVAMREGLAKIYAILGQRFDSGHADTAARPNEGRVLGSLRQENQMSVLLTKHNDKTPGVCGGRACIAGHRVRVQDVVVWHEKRGYSPDEIVDMFPGITLADVYAALTYYFDNQQEIEDELKKADEWAEWLKTNVPSKIPAELREKRGG